MIVVAVIGIITSLSLLNARRASELAKEQVAVSKLHQLAELQTQFRVTLGRHRYGTLSELREAQTGNGPLMSPTLAPIDKEGNPQPSGGWIIQDLSTDSIYPIDQYQPSKASVVKPQPIFIGTDLTRQFGIQAQPVNPSSSSYTYCIFEDGIVRRATPKSGVIEINGPNRACCYDITPPCSRSSEQVPGQ